MPSRPGVDKGEDLLRPCLMWSLGSRSAKGFPDWRPLGGGGSFGEKTWSRRVLLETRSVAPGREGNLGVLLGATNYLAIQMF